MIRRRFAISTVAGLLLVCAPAVCARASETPRIPKSAIAWWRLDPSGFRAVREQNAQRLAVLAALRALVASGVVEDEQGQRFLQGALAAAEVGSAPHSLVLTDFKAHRPPSGRGMDLDRLRMTLSIGAGADHRSLLRTIRAILVGDAAAGENGAQDGLNLPGGRRGVAYAAPDWPAWREIAWSSTESSFVVSLGRGAIDEWFHAQDRDEPAEADKAPWAAHRALVSAARKPGDVFFEAYVNIDELRRRFPDAFATGRTPRTLRALGLDNAHDLMIHGRWIEPPTGAAHPPLIAIDATWTTPASALQSGAGDVGDRALHRLAISEDAWPDAGELANPPPRGSFAVVMRVGWEGLATLALDLVEATRVDSLEPAFQDFRRRWEKTTQSARSGFLESLRPIVVVSDDPPPLIPAPGAATVFLELREGTDPWLALSRLRALLAPVRQRVEEGSDGVSWVRLDDAGFVRAPVWGLAGSARAATIVVGWGASVIEHIRARLGTPKRQTPALGADSPG